MAGPRGRCHTRVGHRQGKGSVGRAGSVTPARSPSPAEPECKKDKYFEFVIHITKNPFGRKKLPDKFAEFLAAREPVDVHLREEFLAARELVDVNLREASCGFF
jgi:hypothetical protein